MNCEYCININISVLNMLLDHNFTGVLITHLGRVTQICVFTLQLRKMDDTNLRF